MRALVQRVVRAEVRSADRSGGWEVVGRIGPGLVALIGVTHEDGEPEAQKLATRIANLRVLSDEDGQMNVSCRDAGASVLVVSQFTLYADASRGRRPSFVAAAPPDQAEPLVATVVDELGALGIEVATGRFRTSMRVELVNDGPVTIMVEV